MQNILWLTENFPPSTGGVQHYLYNTIINFRQLSSYIVCSKHHSQESQYVDAFVESKNNKVIRVDYIPKNNGIKTLINSLSEIVRMCRLLNVIVRNQHISLLIIGHVTFFNLLVLYLISFVSRIPSGAVFHGEDIPVIKMKSNPLKRWLINQVNFRICNSEYTYERLNKFTGRRDKACIAYPGVEDRFFTRVDTSALRTKYGTAKRKIILTVGRLDKRKGHDLIVNSLPSIITFVPDILYLIGGTGEYIDSLKQKVETLDLGNYVLFCGFIPDEDIVAFHQLADIFVMPNRMLEDGDTEGFGIVFLEANASGKPVIGGACGGALDAVENGITGYLVNPYHTEELTERIVYLLTHPEVAHKMGETGRSRAWNCFRWPYLTAKLERSLSEAVVSCPI